tara:strand:+ start:8811 stop:8948 length:138 start_codon:yes stop_codon:yes gene_type:complete
MSIGAWFCNFLGWDTLAVAALHQLEDRVLDQFKKSKNNRESLSAD